MKHIKNAFACLFVLCALNLSAQSTHLKKAKKLYKEKKYAKAIPHYEGALAEKESLSTKTKLANCYRLTNKTDKAEKLYNEIVQNDKVRAINYYYYGEALMSNGKYDLAKEWFLKYSKLEPDDDMGIIRAKACDDVKLIQPYFTNVLINEFSQNSELDDTAPVFYNEGIVFSSDRDMGVRLLKQKSGWTGRDYINLYYSKKKEDGSYDAAKLFSKKLNELNKNTSNFSTNSEANVAVFSRNSHHLSKRNTFNMQLYSTELKDGTSWKKAELIRFCSNEANYMHPCISPDGKQLFFVSDKGGGEGGTDIYISKLGKKGWGRPENLGHKINSSAHEGFPYMHTDGRLFFCSKGHTGYGGFDIFFSEMDSLTGTWTTPVNVGAPINSSHDDISIYLSKNDSTGAFTSSRNGGDDDIYLFEISNTPIEIAAATASTKPILSTIDLAVEKDDQTIISPIEEGEEETTVVDKEVVSEKTILPNTKIQEEKTSTQNNNAQIVESPASQTIVQEELVKATTVVKEKVEEKPSISFTDKKEEGSKIVSDQTLLVNQDPNEMDIDIVDREESLINTTPTFTDITSNRKKTVIRNDVVETNKYEELVSYLAEQQLLVGSSFRLTEAHYQNNEYQVSTQIAEELNRVIDLMYKFPNLKIELGGHTSSLGSEQDNMKLSLDRAKAAATYLSNNGIAKSRVETKAYGEKFPLNHCVNGAKCSPQEHNHNHRIELKVTAF